MSELLTILSVAGLFLLRIGVPVLALIILGIVTERWQTNREDRLAEYYATHPRQ